MIIDILSGRGDSVLFARYTGGILSLSTKKSGGGGSVRGDFVLHSLGPSQTGLFSKTKYIDASNFRISRKEEVSLCL